MLWIVILCISVICLSPACFAFIRKTRGLDVRQSALGLYRNQLLELEQDVHQGLLPQEEYQQTQLEIQRRLLKADQLSTMSENQSTGSSGFTTYLIICGLVMLPTAALGLYMLDGNPALAPQPLATRLAAQKQLIQQAAPLIAALKAKIAELSDHDPNKFNGLVLLGKAEIEQGNFEQAVMAWRQALNLRFDPDLAVQTAEIQIEQEGYVSKENVALLSKALAQAPQEFRWRMLAEQRLAQAEKENQP